ncbi:MAG: hypothetical protein NC212_10310 [Staphylococcus sp.]|nr:hypothetical protein [Staphylococcus sp.]
MKIHLFNPENDLALALGCTHYTPPPHAAAIHAAGALLPMWWAEEGDLLLASGSLCEEVSRLARRFGLHGRIGNPAEADEAAPWGWSADARRQFVRAGVGSDILPSESAINRMRELSHRRSSIKILRELDGDYPIPLETDDADEVIGMERSHPGCYIKSPWSGSGRGVFCARSLDEKSLRSRAGGIIHRQGSVMVERGLDKVADFASLFFADGEAVRFRGLSVFATEPRGMYSGNLVGPQHLLEEKLAALIDLSELSEIIAHEETILTALVGKDYRGWMGVDMMVHRNASGQLRIMPCVELNLRTTMGVVAMKVAEHLGGDSLRFLGWEHAPKGKQPDFDDNSGLILLPPTAGFTLRLK